MHVTEAYAKWSGRINRQIYQHYSDAMSAANEAIANVRTVRAFSAEPAEASRVAGHLSTALAKGIRDSCLGALASMFNNYLDLGAGVLILWYGGSIAMGGGSITVGSLIKYQLCARPLLPPPKPHRSSSTSCARALSCRCRPPSHARPSSRVVSGSLGVISRTPLTGPRPLPPPPGTGT